MRLGGMLLCVAVVPVVRVAAAPAPAPAAGEVLLTDAVRLPLLRPVPLRGRVTREPVPVLAEAPAVVRFLPEAERDLVVEVAVVVVLAVAGEWVVFVLCRAL